jgi:DNA-binding MarR family transcriptional regulator
MAILTTFELMEKIYSLVNAFKAEAKQPHAYGTGHSLYDSEIHLIVAIFNHDKANVSGLARALMVTNGAVSQIANKLVQKGLVEKYKDPANRKDTYFRLTELGTKAYHGHESHHKTMHADAMAFIDSLEGDKIETIAVFLEKMAKRGSLTPKPVANPVFQARGIKDLRKNKYCMFRQGTESRQ